jgi:molybdopterin converting factor subunit 1
MKIIYHAWLKEMVGIGEEVVTLPAEVADVATLINWLSGRGERYEDAFEFSEIIKVAVNDAYVHNDHPVSDDDDVMFFPPIAGG